MIGCFFGSFFFLGLCNTVVWYRMGARGVSVWYGRHAKSLFNPGTGTVLCTTGSSRGSDRGCLRLCLCNNG